VQTLSDIDELYKQTVSKLPKKERLDYCDLYIDKAQLILAKNGRLLSDNQKDNLQQMIQAAQREIKKLK